MAILKLKNAGEEATLAIAEAEIEKGQFGEQVKFTTAGGDVMWVPLSSVVRQLDRCKVSDIPELAGKNIHFSRAASNKPGGAPYWNLDLANADDIRKANGNGNGAAKPQALPNEMGHPSGKGDLPYPQEETGGPPNDVSGFDLLVERYTECFNEAAGFAQRIHKLGLPVDLSGISSIAATLFIARKDARV